MTGTIPLIFVILPFARETFPIPTHAARIQIKTRKYLGQYRHIQIDRWIDRAMDQDRKLDI